jgi:hypothetical protein
VHRCIEYSVSVSGDRDRGEGRADEEATEQGGRLWVPRGARGDGICPQHSDICALTCADDVSWGVRGGRRGAEAAAVRKDRADPGAGMGSEKLPGSLTSSGPSSGASESESASTAALLFFFFFFLFFFLFTTLARTFASACCQNISLVASSKSRSSGVRPLCSQRQMMR